MKNVVFMTFDAFDYLDYFSSGVTKVGVIGVKKIMWSYSYWKMNYNQKVMVHIKYQV